MKNIVAKTLLIFVAASCAALPNAAGGPEASASAAPPKPEPARKIAAYYFHGNFRCGICRKIEALTKKAIEEAYSGDLKKGRLEWRAINIDKPENEHYVKDFQLATRSVVLEERIDGKQKRWKNLARVWQLVHKEDEFKSYIQDEVRNYLEGP